MPYKLLDHNYKRYNYSSEPSDSKPISSETEAKRARLLFLVHDRPDSIGGVQRHNARLREALINSYIIERYNWKNPENRLPVNFPALYHKARQTDFSVIYCDDAVSSIVGAKVLGRLNDKIVATVHGLDIIVPLPGYQSVVSNSLKKLNKVVCVSRATAQEAVKRGVKPENIEVIPNAVEVVSRMIEKNESLYDEIKVITGIDLKGKKVLFSLGRPLKRKGFDWFITNVFPRLPDDYIYIVAGPEPRKPGWLKALKIITGGRFVLNIELALGHHMVHDELIKLSEHPRVLYLNGVSEHLRNLLYAASDLFIMPNRSIEGDMEGFGIVALEAAVRGAPVIATGIEGITDAVIDGENGYCVSEGDDIGMAKVIMSLMNNPEKITSLGRRAGEFTRKHFAIESIARRYENIFEELIRDERKNG